MPTESGAFKGISVSKVWPGHRDYQTKTEVGGIFKQWEIVPGYPLPDGEIVYIPKERDADQ